MNENKTIVVTGEGIPMFRLLSLRGMLRLEVRTELKMSRGISVLKQIKKEFPQCVKKNKAETLAAFEAYVEEQSNAFKAKGAHGIESV